MDVMAFLVANWEWFLLGFVVLEKIVKVTPVQWDDIIVDGIKEVLSRVVTQYQPPEPPPAPPADETKPPVE